MVNNSFKISEFYQNLNHETDILICSSSFESRCLGIPNELSKGKVSHSIICHYEDNYKQANDNFDILQNSFPTALISSFVKDDPIGNLDNLLKNIHGINEKYFESKGCCVVLDITTFTHEMILILIYLFKKYLSQAGFSLKILYLTAIEYSVNESVESEKWLSRGVGAIRTVLGYSGELSPLKKTLLVILVGYEEERVRSIIEMFEPAKVLLGHASKSGAIAPSLLPRNVKAFNNIQKDFSSILGLEIDAFEFTCRQPSEVQELISTIIGKYKDEFNIIVSCLNNKISTIGCALAGIANPEIQMCYPTANQYNFLNYSIAGDEVFIFEL